MFTTELFQNEALFDRVRAVEPRTAAQRQLKKDLIETFEDTGVALPQDRRARAKAISEQLVVLNQEFSRNIRDNETRLTFTPAECEGLPEGYLARVPRDADGNVVLGFDYPDFNPFMANARERGGAAPVLHRVPEPRHGAQRRDPRRDRRAPPRARRPLRSPQLRALRDAPAHGRHARTPCTRSSSDVRCRGRRGGGAGRRGAAQAEGRDDRHAAGRRAAAPVGRVVLQRAAARAAVRRRPGGARGSTSRCRRRSTGCST